MNKVLCCVFAGMLSIFSACGAAPGTDAMGPDRTGSSGGGSFTGECCINGAYYACGSQAAFDKCAGGNPAKCHEGCGADIDCHIRCDDQAAMSRPDPADCQRDTSKDGTCSSGGGGSSCIEKPNLQACTYSSQCSSGNCTKGRCYGNENGALCTYSSQCSSGNCTGGCCAGNSKGSACSYSSQCDSGNCTGGKCQGRSSGSACNYSSQCDSGNCTGGRCR
jgi:hypothetical protein